MKHLLMMLLALMLSAGALAQNADALYKEGKALYDAKNYQKAFPKLKAAADKGHKKAQYRVGRCYDKGYAVAKNDAVAVSWYRKSASQGYAKAQYQLAKCYLNGEGGAKDEAKAKAWLNKAVKDEKHGKEIRDKINQNAAEGKDEAKRLKRMIK